MMKRFLTGVLSIIAGTALVLTSFAGACSEDTGSVNGPPAQETPSAAFRGPSGTLSETETVPEPEPEWIEAVATAYCPCERCCGSWALNRPDGIVYTASGAEAVQGVTIAADWSIYPPGPSCSWKAWAKWSFRTAAERSRDRRSTSTSRATTTPFSSAARTSGST